MKKRLPEAIRSSIDILVVDDSMLTRTILREVLRDEGYNVIGEAHSGDQAMEMLSNKVPDIVTLDVNMPGMDGISVLRHLQEHFPSVWVVMITASNAREVIKSAYDAGAIGYISKPLTVKKIATLFAHLAIIVAKSKPQENSLLDTAAKVSREVPWVVVIDDSKAMRKLLRVILEEGGYFVASCTDNGMDGLLQIEKYRPDLICMDIDHPKINGMQMLKCIKATHPTLPVVVISSRADRDTIENALNNGVNSYLIKPFCPDNVLTAIKSVLVAQLNRPGN